MKLKNNRIVGAAKCRGGPLYLLPEEDPASFITAGAREGSLWWAYRVGWDHGDSKSQPVTCFFSCLFWVKRPTGQRQSTRGSWPLGKVLGQVDMRFHIWESNCWLFLWDLGISSNTIIQKFRVFLDHNRLHVDIFWLCFHPFEVYSTYSSTMIDKFPEVLSLNWLFLELNMFICD